MGKSSISFFHPLFTSSTHPLFFGACIAGNSGTLVLELETDHLLMPVLLFPIHCAGYVRALSPCPYPQAIPGRYRYIALFFVKWGLSYWNLNIFIQEHTAWILLIGALIGIIPESGPHMVFVMMYAEGLIPFSVLFTTSFVQDGHGMLPLLSYSVKDSLVIKAFNFVFGLAVGGVFFAFGF